LGRRGTREGGIFQVREKSQNEMTGKVEKNPKALERSRRRGRRGGIRRLLCLGHHQLISPSFLIFIQLDDHLYEGFSPWAASGG
jgi:hypothetical protein